MHLFIVDMSIGYAKYGKYDFFPGLDMFCESASVEKREKVALLSVLRGPNTSCQMVKYKPQCIWACTVLGHHVSYLLL